MVQGKAQSAHKGSGGKIGKHGAEGTHETRIKVIRVIEGGGEMDTAEVAARAKISKRAAGGQIGSLIKLGILDCRIEERVGKGRQDHRFVRRSEMPLPAVVEEKLDSTRWPHADFRVMDAMRAMAYVGKPVKAVPYANAVYFGGLTPVGRCYGDAQNDAFRFGPAANDDAAKDARKRK